MRFVTGSRKGLERRLKQRGATWASIAPAIEGDHLADPVSVDVDHEAYPKPPCERCGATWHWLKDCPVPADTTPENERQRAKRGGCCGPATA